MHVSHLKAKSEETINLVLGMASDVDMVQAAMSKQKNPETRKVYLYIFTVSDTLNYLEEIHQHLPRSFPSSTGPTKIRANIGKAGSGWSSGTTAFRKTQHPKGSYQSTGV